MVAFEDKAFKEPEPLPFWERVLNEEGFREGKFRGSVHDYFYDQSYGQLSLQFDLLYVKLDKSYKVYGGTDSKGNDEDYVNFVNDIVNASKDQVADWSVYDWDGDRQVDHIFIIYAGLGQNDGGGVTTIWPNQWTLTEALADHPEMGGEAPMTMDGGYIVDRYGCVAELDLFDSYGSFGVLCHEYSHCLGLPDFYRGSTKFVGSWDVMDYGLYNGDGFCPPGYSAHERMLLGWLEPTTLDAPETVSELLPLNTSQQAYMIVNDGHPNEYYMIENRQRTGWDRYLSGSGVLIFHVDYDEEAWAEGYPNSSSHVRYGILAANNSNWSWSGWGYPFEENDSLTNLSRPAAMLLNSNVDGSYLMSKPITNIRVNFDGAASFDFKGGNVTAAAVLRAEGKHRQVLYDLGTVEIVRFDDGSVRKIVKRRR